MSNMCFTTVANRLYQQYIPWFAYFINRAYPDAKCIFLLDCSLDDHVNDMLSNLDSTKFIVKEWAFNPHKKLDALSIKYLRWLTHLPEFEEFDCLYIGDVDMAIFREEPNYADQHLAHCKMTGLPYSNFVRPNNNKAMCGIHIVKPKEWFQIMMPIMMEYKDRFDAGKIHYTYPSQNEKMLYQMISESRLGSPPQDLLDTYYQCLVSSNHHGIHIRNAGLNGFQGLQCARRHEIHRGEIIESTKTPLFQKLKIQSPGIGDMLAQVARWYETSVEG